MGLQGRNPEHHGQAPDRQRPSLWEPMEHTDRPLFPTAVLVTVPQGLKKVGYFLFYKSHDSSESTSHFPRRLSFLRLMCLLGLSTVKCCGALQGGLTDSALCPGRPGEGRHGIIPFGLSSGLSCLMAPSCPHPPSTLSGQDPAFPTRPSGIASVLSSGTVFWVKSSDHVIH